MRTKSPRLAAVIAAVMAGIGGGATVPREHRYARIKDGVSTAVHGRKLARRYAQRAVPLSRKPVKAGFRLRALRYGIPLTIARWEWSVAKGGARPPAFHFDRMNAAADRIAPPVGYRRRVGCGCGQPMARVTEDDAGTWTATCGCGRSASGPTLREAREKLEANR